jgi:ubiquinone/menaquinone biosynthesis C-methylase UbiE
MQELRSRWDKYYSIVSPESFSQYDLRIRLISKNVTIENLITLEVGSGLGTDSLQLAKLGARTTCLDVSGKGLDLAKNIYRKFSTPGSFVVGDGNKLCFKNDSFDLVFNAGVIEHFKDPSSIISEMRRVSKKYVMVWVPQKYHLYTLRKHKKIEKKEWEFGWETEYSYLELKNLMEKFNLKIIDSLGSAPATKIPKIDMILKKYFGRMFGLEVGVLCEKK